MEFWIASGNAGKIREYRMLLKELPLEIHSQSELSTYSSPEETGSTFKENSLIKAKGLHAVKSDVWVLSEDSGLEVDGLGGHPGVHSARYAGPRATDVENNAKVLQMLKLRSPQNRAAQFYCALTLISPDKKEHTFEGTIRGKIITSPRGDQGFGYDPLFAPEGEEKTLAELGLTYKNQHSHRFQAAQALIQFLKETL